MKDIIVVFLVGYVLGNFQTSYLMGKLIYKVDIRTLGHGNAGASNALDSIGLKFGLLVAFVDVAKGLISILIIKHFYQIGHIYPIIMKFKGGKGTATLIGVLLGFNVFYGIAAMLIIIVFTFITDYVAISTGILVVCVVGLTIFEQLGTIPILLSIFGALLSLYKHLPNYKRITKNEEGRLSLA